MHDDLTFIPSLEERALAPTDLSLVIIASGHVRSRPLVARTVVRVGRGESNDVRLEGNEISRLHAQLTVGESASSILLEDLGSDSGTRVGGRAISKGNPWRLEPGQLVEIGSAVLFLQREGAVRRPARMYSYGYFAGRLDDAQDGWARARVPFAVARVSIPTTDDGETAAIAVLDELRPQDVASRFADGEYAVLLIDRTPEELERFGERLRSRLGSAARIVSAGAPRDGTTAEQILSAASSGANAARRAGPRTARPDEDIVVEDENMRSRYLTLKKYAQSTISILLVGETGVGKTQFAERVAAWSPRADKPFVVVDLAQLSTDVLESELFGHEKGAFTGADRRRVGMIESAGGGTVFFDEIGELPLALQPKLLRTLQSRSIRRMGSNQETPVDVRFVFATNRDLAKEVREGRFREDLYYRIKVATIDIPPLRTRPGEIVALAEHFAARHWAREGGDGTPSLRPDASTLLERYSWPGNVRELSNVMHLAVVRARPDTMVTPEHLPEEIKWSVPPSRASAPSPDPGSRSVELGEDEWTPDELAERAKTLGALEQTGGNQTRAAVLLGINRKTLVKRIDKYRLPYRSRSDRSADGAS